MTSQSAQKPFMRTSPSGEKVLKVRYIVNHNCMDIAQSSLQSSSAKIDEIEILRRKGYHIRGLVGEGSYSKVKRAFSKHLNGDVAIKIVVGSKAPTVFREKFLPREIEILSRVRHSKIVKVYEIFETKRRPDGDALYIVTEFAKRGDLLEFVKERGAMDEIDGRNVIRDIIEAVAYLHGSNIAHRDIKCENILLDTCRGREGLAFIAKLCDFGFARNIQDAPDGRESGNAGSQDHLSRTFCGSAAYAAPEVLQRRAHDAKCSDVWATGVVAFITLYGAMPYDDADIKAMVAIQRRNKIPSCHKKISRPAREVIKSILRYDPAERPGISELLAYRWFRLDTNKLRI